MNQKSILILFIFCCFALNGYSQIVSTESFDPVTFAPAGWSIKPDLSGTTAGNVWVRRTTGTNPTALPHSGPAMARFSSRNFIAGTKQILVTRPIDYTNRGTSVANLDFWMFRDSLLASNLDSMSVWVNSTDTLDGTAVNLGHIARNRSIALPDTQSANGWYHYTFSIPASFTGTTTRFIFEGSSQSVTVGSGAHMYIDDVSFDEFPAICTGTPNVGSILNPTPIVCGGSGSASLGLTAPISGLAGISYNWEESATSVGPWTTTGTNAAILSIPLISSTTFYRCTVNCSFSALSYTTPVDSIVVSTNTPPTVMVTPSNAAFCAGTTGVQLIASGALTYSWLPATGLNTTTGDTVMASPILNTQYIVLGIDVNGCPDTAIANVILNSGPAVNITANPDDTVCVGTQVVLTSVATGTTGNVYAWSDGTTTRRDTIIVTANITLNVAVTNAAGCSNYDTITVVATPGSAANFGYTYTGNTYTFTDSSSTATNWTWTFGDGNGSTNQNPVYTYSAPGTYTITLIISGTPCNDDTISKVIVIGPQGINDLSDELLVNYYPNPVNDVLSIESGNRLIAGIIMRNSIGQKVMTYTNAGKNKIISIPVHSLSAGIYFAELMVDGKKQMFKFIKE